METTTCEAGRWSACSLDCAIALEWIEANGAAKFKEAILDVAGDLDDLKHITEPDFEELVRGMPKLKARRLRASLVELGARLA